MKGKTPIVPTPGNFETINQYQQNCFHPKNSKIFENIFFLLESQSTMAWSSVDGEGIG